MPECELCGQDTLLQLYRIESADVMACSSCGRFGTPLTKKSQPFQKSKSNSTTLKSNKSSFKPTTRSSIKRRSFSSNKLVLMEDYGIIINRARKKLGLSRKELAESLFIRETLLMRIETEKVRPKDDLVHKLEKSLDITLMESSDEDLVRVSQYQSKQFPQKSRTLTLGDFAKIKKSKK